MSAEGIATVSATTQEGCQITCGSKTISTVDVTHILYGYAPIQLDMWTIGSRYTIQLKTPGDTVTFHFRSYFGISKKQRYEQYARFLDEIWESTVVRLVNEFIEHVDNGESISIGKCLINNQGITCNHVLIPWDDLLYQKNYNKLTINSKSNEKVFTNLYYIEVYNVHILSFYLDWRFEKTGK